MIVSLRITLIIINIVFITINQIYIFYEKENSKVKPWSFFSFKRIWLLTTRVSGCVYVLMYFGLWGKGKTKRKVALIKNIGKRIKNMNLKKKEKKRKRSTKTNSHKQSIVQFASPFCFTFGGPRSSSPIVTLKPDLDVLSFHQKKRFWIIKTFLNLYKFFWIFSLFYLVFNFEKMKIEIQRAL